MKPNLSNISPELKEKMLRWEKNKPEFRQLQVMEDVADMVQELVNLGDSSKEATEKLGALLMDAREQLIRIADRKDPETPDYTKPIVNALGTLQKALESKEYNPTIKVAAPKIDTPVANVTVDAPDVSGIEKLLKTEMPKAFEKAISLIPEPEKIDNSDILSKFDEMFEWLESIDQATRKKPLPGSMVISNSPSQPVPITGSITASASTLAEFQVNDIEDDTTSYFGFTEPDGTWLVKKVTDTLVSYATVTNNDTVTSYTDAWTDRATLTYGRIDEAF